MCRRTLIYTRPEAVDVKGFNVKVNGTNTTAYVSVAAAVVI